jgi:hypothetical protein
MSKRTGTLLTRRLGLMSSPAALVPRPPSKTVLPSSISVTAPNVKYVPPLEKLRRFPVASIDLSRADVGLPYGTPRRVNAATLKVLAGGQKADSLMKKTQDGWVFVDDDAMIDLADNSLEFKLGRLTIFS